MLEHLCDGCKFQGQRFIEEAKYVTVFCNRNFRWVTADFNCLEKERIHDANCANRKDKCG